MSRLSIMERFVLFAIQRNAYDLTASALMRLTGQPSISVENAIQTLKSLRLMEAVEENGTTYYIPVCLGKAPLVPDFRNWLNKFCSMYPQVEEQDDDATTYSSCGVIILSAVLTGSRNARFLGQMTGFPEGFVLLVLGIMDRLELWWSERVFDLQQTLCQSALDYADVDLSLHSVKEEFWNACWTPEVGEVLKEFRARRQFGNLEDRWLNDDDTDLRPRFIM